VLAGCRKTPVLRQISSNQQNHPYTAAYVATDAHLDPDSPWKINRTLPIDKIKRQIGRWLLAAAAKAASVPVPRLQAGMTER